MDDTVRGKLHHRYDDIVMELRRYLLKREWTRVSCLRAPESHPATALTSKAYLLGIVPHHHDRDRISSST